MFVDVIALKMNVYVYKAGAPGSVAGSAQCISVHEPRRKYLIFSALGVPSRHRHSGRFAMAEDVLETVKDGVAVLTLNRPDRLNAMSGPMLDTLLEALPRLAEDPAVGVVVLTGAGRGFCAGGDVKAMAEGREFGGTTLEEKAQALRSRMEVSGWLHEMPKPTIAVVRRAAARRLGPLCHRLRARRLLGRLRRQLVSHPAGRYCQGPRAVLHGGDR